jgi:PAS domain-containing protein
VTLADLTAALLLPLPPWLGFWIFRRKGRVGLSYGYFLGGILAILALPWPRLSGHQVPTALLGSALFGFTLFLQAQREGTQGLRRLGVGVGGASLFALFLLAQQNLPWRTIPRFWAGAVLEGLLWLLLADLAHRLTRGRFLELRMPLVGAGALGLGALGQVVLPPDVPRLPWGAAVLGGLLLGLVALEQLRWLRAQGAWIEGRAQGLRMALGLLDQSLAPEAPGLTYGLDPRQAQWLVDEKGRVLESNGPFSRLVGLPRHRLRGYGMDALFQGGEKPVWASMQDALLREGAASVQATQVSEDGAFREVRLESVAFDRGIALVWISDPVEGSLTLRTNGHGFQDCGRGVSALARLNALSTLALAAEQSVDSAPAGPAREAAMRLLAAARRLGPDLDTKDGSLPAAPFDLAALVAHLGRLLPGQARLEPALRPVPLQANADLLTRLATLLLLHAAEGGSGTIRLQLDPVDLGGRTWGLLQASRTNPQAPLPSHMIGLGWLHAAVLEARGMLELDQSAEGGLSPRIYLPAAPGEPLPPRPLAGRRIWVAEQDPLLRDSLVARMRQWAGDVEGYEDLAALLRGSRGSQAPDALVLERTPQLDRFQKALRTFQREPIPTLVMGSGHTLPVNPSQLGLRRLGFIEKPFSGPEFAQALLALLHPSEAGPQTVL